MKCPRCQQENSAGAKFCNGCGARLELVCQACSHPNLAGSRFCNECGKPLDSATASAPAPKFGSLQTYTPKHLAEKILTSKSALEGERKQVTVLFADLKGSMELLADRDPEEARKLLDPVLEHMMEAVHRYEGTVNQVMGDGIMALFGAPLAHEDHAVRACYAALRMQESVKRYAEGVRRTEGIPIQIRVGLNSGEVVVRSIGSDLRMDYTAVGQTTHLAARMEQLATPGSVLLSADALRLAEGYVQVKTLGPIPVKGLPEPVEVYEATGGGAVRTRLQAAAMRGFTRFVGRDTELDQLRRALQQAYDGRGQIVAVVGEPGVGKSRLFWEFTHSHRTEGWLILESGSSSYGKATAYLPITDLLKGYFKIQDRDDHREIREKVTGKLLTLDRALESILPPLLTLLDVPVEDPQWEAADPPQRRRQTLDAVKRLLLRESQVQPVLVVFEDLHWIDSESQAFLDSLLESLPTAQFLLLVNYRPEYQHNWGSKSYYTQLRIDPLLPENAHELLHSLLGTDAGLQSLKQLLIDRTGGNPFFLEESVRTLVETEALVGERGSYRLVKDLPSVQVPATVQAVLAARIDRLPPEDKQLLQSASVIGESLPFNLLQAVVEMQGEELHRHLRHLQAVEFLYETGLFPDLEYTFKHGLTYQVAYNSLLVDRRRSLHAKILDTIEGLYADRLSEQVDRLAHHALRGELWSTALPYLRQAGVKAATRSAYQEAVAYFEQALGALEHLPESGETVEQAIDIRVELGPVLIAIKGFGAAEVESSYNSARELCEKIGETPQLFPVLWGLWLANGSRGRLQIARELGERLLAIAEREQDTSLLLQAHHALWTTLVNFGDLASAKDHLEQGMALYDPQQHRSHAFLYGGHDPGVCCRNHSAMTLFMMGYPDQALKNAQDAVRLARELSHPFSITQALFHAAWTYYQRGDRQGTAEHAKAAVEIATDLGISQFINFGSALLADLRVVEGHGDEGHQEIERALTAVRPMVSGGRTVMFLLSLLAESYRRRGQTEQGLETVATALTMIEENSHHYMEPELIRVRGNLLLAQSDPTLGEAEVCFLRAIEIARTMQEKSLELRAVMSLSRLWQKQGKKEEARRMLTEIYGWFTEGFDTADLKEAKALLEELS